MDFSSCINFDEIEEKQAIIKPKISIRKGNIRLFSSTHRIESPAKKSQSFYISEDVTESNPLISDPVYIKIEKRHPVRTYAKNSRFFAFEGKKVRLASLKSLVSLESPCSKNSRNLSPISHRVNRITFRRVKLSPKKLRPQSCGEVHEIFPENHQKKVLRNIRVVKRELIPQTKAKNSKGAERFKPELRINGVMKDFVNRENSVKFKDSADMIDLDN